MKKFIAVAFFCISALVSVHVFAGDVLSVASANKPVPVTLAERGMAVIRDENDADHLSGRREYGMMGQYSVDVMMESNMHMLEAMALGNEQKSAINKLFDEFKHKIWFVQGLINDESAKLSYLYEADRRDPVAIGKEYMNIFDLKRQMIETYLETQNRIEDILTPEQRTKMKQSRHEQEMQHTYGHPLK